MVAGIRSITAALGTGDKVPAEAELAIAAVARRSLHWARSLAPGATDRGGGPRRPAAGDGTAPGTDRRTSSAQTVRRAITAGAMVSTDDVEGLP